MRSVLSFIIFWYVFGYNGVAKQDYFQTAWFVTCLVTELMIIYNVTTSKEPFSASNASKIRNGLIILASILTVLTPILLHKIKTFNFVVLPPVFYLYLIILVLLYFGIVLVIKKIYIKKYNAIK